MEMKNVDQPIQQQNPESVVGSDLQDAISLVKIEPVVKQTENK